MAVHPLPLSGLALCAGAGGLELGLTIAVPGYRTVCFVERDAHAAATLVARMADQAPTSVEPGELRVRISIDAAYDLQR